MAKPLAGRVAIVTGSSRGIGRCIAETLAERGASVVVNHADRADGAAAADVVDTIRLAGGQALAVRADVTSVADIEMLFAAAASRYGGVDIVVSNAGAAAPIKPIVGITEAEYDATLAINARAGFFVLREAARRVRDGGRILIISSTTAVTPFAGTATYSGAKAACETFARVLAKEVGPRGITVNALSPGPIDTAVARVAGSPEVRFAGAISMTPLGRLGTREDIARVVSFVVSDDARWVTGQLLRVGGGIV